MQNVTDFEEKRINAAERRSNEDRRNTLPARGMLETVSGGAFAESAGGIGAVVLTILGLSGIAPVLLTSIAAIAIGAVMLIKGVAVSAEYGKVAHEVVSGRAEAAELSGGLSGEIVAGVAAVVLGILSLLSVSTLILLPIAAIVLGVGIVLSSGADARISNLGAGEQKRWYQKAMNKMVSASIGAELLVGLGAAVLGILALVGLAPAVLTLVAMLALGATALLSGISLGGKMLNMVHGT